MRKASWSWLLLVSACGGDPGLTADAAIDAGADAGMDAGPLFLPGPYGTAPWDRAGTFAVPTIDGSLDFEGAWTGRDSWVFLVYAPGQGYSEQLWTSSVQFLLEDSPDNTHYVFLSYADSDGADRAMTHVQELRTRAQAALAMLPLDRQAHWTPRLHYVTTQALGLGNWISEMLAARSVFTFAIDPFQRLRNTGLLGSPLTRPFAARMFFLAHEAQYFEFEWQREQSLATDVTAVELFAAEQLTGGDAFASVTLPTATAMLGFDTLEVDLTTSCLGHDETKCWEWDRLAALYLCDIADPMVCNTEIARWITTYRREGRWVTDVSMGLAHLAAGGPRRFRFNAGSSGGPATPYIIDLSLRFSNQGRGKRPSEAIPLFAGSTLDATYNARYAPTTIAVPADVRRVEVQALITGHGFAADTANCAEFCDHTHHFTVNGTEWSKEHPEAGTQLGCQRQIDQGTVPNQYGTWPLGRGGWCPGLDVVPWVADVTASITPGADNVVSYRALVGGVPFVPVSTGMAGTTPAYIVMNSWLVYWR